MAKIEIIQENSAKFQLFEELKDNRLPVQVTLLNGNFNGTTHVNRIRQRINMAYFRTMNMRSYAAAIGKDRRWQSRFDFSGKDNIRYSFRTTGWRISRDGIWHRFPDIIERRQRRKFFRLEIPFQTDIFLILGPGRYRMTAVDISIGGIFVEFIGSEEITEKEPLWRVGDRFEGLLVETDLGGKTRRIQIDEGILRRSEGVPPARKGKYAFEFSKMAKSAETTLTDLVYELQRKILKERIRLEA